MVQTLWQFVKKYNLISFHKGRKNLGEDENLGEEDYPVAYITISRGYVIITDMGASIFETHKYG